MSEPTVRPVIYGLIDTKDNMWMGTNESPWLSTDEELAKFAAQLCCTRLKWPSTRVKAIPYDFTGIRMAEELTCQRTAEEAIELLESGKIL